MFKEALLRPREAELALTDLGGSKTQPHTKGGKTHEQIKSIRQNQHHFCLFRWFPIYYFSSYPNSVTLKGLMTLDTSNAPLLREPQGSRESPVNKPVPPFILQDLYRPLSSDDLDSVGDSV